MFFKSLNYMNHYYFISNSILIFNFKILNFSFLSCCTKWSFPKKLQLYSIFTNPSTQAGYDTRSILKQSITGLSSEFSFSLTSCLTKAEELSLPNYFPWRENNWIHTFPKGISAMWNAISLIQDLNSCHRVHFQWQKPLHHGHLQLQLYLSLKPRASSFFKWEQTEGQLQKP